MAKRKLTPRRGDGPPPEEPPPGGWTLMEAMRKLAGEDRVEAYLAAVGKLRDARTAPKEKNIGFDRLTNERIDFGERRHRRTIEEAQRTAVTRRHEMMGAFRTALRSGLYAAEGRPGGVTAEITPIAADQWDSLDDLDLDRSAVAESRPGGGGFFSVRVRLAESTPAAKGGRPPAIDWNAALDAFLLEHIRSAEFETKAQLVEAFAGAIERSGGKAPDPSTVRKWLRANLPHLYARAEAPQRGG